MPTLGKKALKDELLARLRADLETLEATYRAAREGAIHEEAKPENDKDTRALEQSYLARGQAARIEDLRSGLAAVAALPTRDFAGAPVALGALATLEEDGDVSTVFFSPSGGGTRLASGTVQVVTPASPLGSAMLGRREGEEFELLVAGRTRTMLVVKVT
jgi:transcription elongation GreA/GreB family factor